MDEPEETTHGSATETNDSGKQEFANLARKLERRITHIMTALEMQTELQEYIAQTLQRIALLLDPEDRQMVAHQDIQR
jgi:hypothetical protein